jgi:hypothetical protein
MLYISAYLYVNPNSVPLEGVSGAVEENKQILATDTPSKKREFFVGKGGEYICRIKK